MTSPEGSTPGAVGKIDAGVATRAIFSVLLAAVALALFFWSRSPRAVPGAITPTLGEKAAEIDREVDSAFARLKVDAHHIAKRRVTVPNDGFVRIERRVLLPREILPVQLNVTFSSMARRFGARAIASENIKENTVTIHIELEGWIIQTIILKQVSEGKPPQAEHRQLKA